MHVPALEKQGEIVDRGIFLGNQNVSIVTQVWLTESVEVTRIDAIRGILPKHSSKDLIVSIFLWLWVPRTARKPYHLWSHCTHALEKFIYFPVLQKNWPYMGSLSRKSKALQTESLKLGNGMDRETSCIFQGNLIQGEIHPCQPEEHLEQILGTVVNVQLNKLTINTR